MWQPGLSPPAASVDVVREQMLPLGHDQPMWMPCFLADERSTPWAGLAWETWCHPKGAGGRPHTEPCMSCALLQDYYYLSVKALYTVGYSTSLVTLTTAMVILCRFR